MRTAPPANIGLRSTASGGCEVEEAGGAPRRFTGYPWRACSGAGTSLARSSATSAPRVSAHRAHDAARTQLARPASAPPTQARQPKGYQPQLPLTTHTTARPLAARRLRARPTRAPYARTHRGHSRALEQPIEVGGRLGAQQQRHRVHVREHSLERLLG